MITRRSFIGFSTLSLFFLPVLGCSTLETDTDVSWFLSEPEIKVIGKLYSSNSFMSIDTKTLLINGWVLTLAEAEVCKKKFSESA